MLPLPTLVAHCDWGSTPQKRWMATATLASGRFTAHAPEPVGDLTTLLPRLRERAQKTLDTQTSTPILLGLDLPIGLPAAYAQRTGIPAFLPFLASLTPASDFFHVASHPGEISLRRPFYPRTPGNSRRHHLTDALQIPWPALLRLSEQAQAHRPAAAPLFWTMGAQQSGKAAILAWRDLILPALLAPTHRSQQIQIWPFHGPLPTLLSHPAITVAEAYPAQYHHALFVKLPGSKTSQPTRAAIAPALLHWAAIHQLRLTPALTRKIRTGFPPQPPSTGDDPFDAVIGLFGILHSLLHYSPQLDPIHPTLTTIEGHILGQPSPSPQLASLPVSLAENPSPNSFQLRLSSN